MSTKLYTLNATGPSWWAVFSEPLTTWKQLWQQTSTIKCKQHAAGATAANLLVILNRKPRPLNVCFCNWHAYAQSYNWDEFTHGSMLMYTNVFAAW